MPLPMNSNTIYNYVPDEAKRNSEGFYLVMDLPRTVVGFYYTLSSYGISENMFHAIIMQAMDDVATTPAIAIEGNRGTIDYDRFPDHDEWSEDKRRVIESALATLVKVFYHLFGSNGLIYSSNDGHSMCDFFPSKIFKEGDGLRALLTYIPF